MGLLSGLLTLPLAPVRGTVWIAELLAEEAARQLDEEAAIRGELERLALDHDLGRIDADEFEQREDALLDRLAELREAEMTGARDIDTGGGGGGGNQD